MVLPPKFMGGVSRRTSSPGRPSGPEKTKYRVNERPTKFGNDANLTRWVTEVFFSVDLEAASVRNVS